MTRDCPSPGPEAPRWVQEAAVALVALPRANPTVCEGKGNHDLTVHTSTSAIMKKELLPITHVELHNFMQIFPIRSSFHHRMIHLRIHLSFPLQWLLQDSYLRCSPTDCGGICWDSGVRRCTKNSNDTQELNTPSTAAERGCRHHSAFMPWLIQGGNALVKLGQVVSTGQLKNCGQPQIPVWQWK